MTSLLPPNATTGERALETALRADIDLSAVGTLWDPATCPADVLPFLAWGLAISHWDFDWTEAEKRAAIAAAIPFHQVKGTRAAVEQVLERFHPLLTVVEWHQANPPQAPHTFEVRAPAEIGAAFLTAETAAAIIRDVAAAKPLRAHFDFIQVLEAQAAVYLAAGGMAGGFLRARLNAVLDDSRDWSIVLQTENGEPVFAPDGITLLETS